MSLLFGFLTRTGFKYRKEVNHMKLTFTTDRNGFELQISMRWALWVKMLAAAGSLLASPALMCLAKQLGW